jgi:signal transduction histidine kinase
MPRAPLQHYVPASFSIGGCAIFLSLIGMLIFQQGGTAQQLRSSMDHTRALLADVNELNVLTRDAERGQRGYLLTGMPEYLAPYKVAIEQLPPLYEHFRQLVADNPLQQQQSVMLWSLIQQKLAELAQTIQLRTDSGDDAARHVVQGDLGRSLMAQITAALDVVLTEENRQLAERRSAIGRTDATIRLLTAGGSVLAVLSLGLAALMLRRGAARQRRIEQEKEQQRRELEQSNADIVRHADLVRYTEALERSNTELDDFAYIASHDLKEPLRGLFNNARFLHEDYAEKLDREGVSRLLRLGYLCQRMEQLINDLLYFSRIGRQELGIQLTDLNEIIRDIEMMSETTLQECNAAIVIPNELPRISCDKTRISEVFRNLIVNAIKYNDSATKLVEVGYCDEIKTRDGTETQVFYVKDNGIGIAEEFHEDIFRIFKRLNAEDDDKKGTGVGLTFVRKIVERHGGRIWLASALGEGTTFYFTIAQGAAYAA